MAVCQSSDQSNCKKVFIVASSLRPLSPGVSKQVPGLRWANGGCGEVWFVAWLPGMGGADSSGCGLQQSPDHTNSYWEVRSSGIWRVMSTGTAGSDWKAALCNKPHCKHHHTAGFEDWGRYSNIVNTF